MKQTPTVVLATFVALSLVVAGSVGPGRARAAAGAPTRERTFLVVERDGARQIVTLRGFPALRRDGRVVATYEQRGDFVAGTIVLLDVATGRELERIAMPERVWQTDEGDVGRRVDRGGVRRVNRILARYVPLAQLVREDDPPSTTGGATTPSTGNVATARFTSERHRAEVRTDYTTDGDPRTTLTIRSDAGSTSRLLAASADADQIESVAVSPDGSFFVVQNGMCGCECSYWATIAR